MPIVETITVSLIDETGYTTWFDFVFQISGYTGSNGKYTYYYTHAQGGKREITLDITQDLLERLALEQAKLILPLLNVNSFSTFEQLVQEHKIRREYEFYYLDVIVRNKENELILKRIRYRVIEIERLLSWETKYKKEVVYVEKREPMD